MNEVVHKRANVTDFPMNKPWGFDINPELWYLMHETRHTIGITTGVCEESDGRTREFVLCFGNLETMNSYAHQCLKNNISSLKPVKGSQVLEIFLEMHLSETVPHK